MSFEIGDQVRWLGMEHLGVGRVVEDTGNLTRDGEAGVHFPMAAYPSEAGYHAIPEDELAPAGGIKSHASSVRTFEGDLDDVLQGVRNLLLEKNGSYGDSALNPVRIFSEASTEEQIRVRIDDKLSRLARGSDYADEDTVEDLLGYLILLKIAQSR